MSASPPSSGPAILEPWFTSPFSEEAWSSWSSLTMLRVSDCWAGTLTVEMAERKDRSGSSQKIFGASSSTSVSTAVSRSQTRISFSLFSRSAATPATEPSRMLGSAMATGIIASISGLTCQR
ncbi:hypothetical protein D3C72_1875470 [compost metagenome]